MSYPLDPSLVRTESTGSFGAISGNPTLTPGALPAFFACAAASLSFAGVLPPAAFFPPLPSLAAAAAAPAAGVFGSWYLSAIELALPSGIRINSAAWSGLDESNARSTM